MGRQRETGEEELPEQDAPQAQDTGSDFQGMMQQQASNRQQQINQRVERQGVMDRAYNPPARRRTRGSDNPFLGLLAQLGQGQGGLSNYSNTEGAWFGAPQQQQTPQTGPYGAPMPTDYQPTPEEFYAYRAQQRGR